MYVTGICRISIFQPNKQSLVSLAKILSQQWIRIQVFTRRQPLLGRLRRKKKSQCRNSELLEGRDALNRQYSE